MLLDNDVSSLTPCSASYWEHSVVVTDTGC